MAKIVSWRELVEEAKNHGIMFLLLFLLSVILLGIIYVLPVICQVWYLWVLPILFYFCKSFVVK